MQKKHITKNNNTYKKITIAILPFIALLLIGLIKGDITYHQKIFKTYLIFIFDFALLALLILRAFGKEGFKKEIKYYSYFLFYFLFILIQFVVSFYSKEVSYDRDYYLGNYISLIVFSLLVFVYIKSLNEIKTALLLIQLFFVIVLILGFYELYKAKWVFYDFRPPLTFGNTDYFAGYAIGLLPFSLIAPILFYDTKKTFIKNRISIITSIAALISFAPIFLSQTRAALLGCYFGMIVIFIPALIYLINKLSLKIKIILIISILFIFIAGPVLLLKFPPPFFGTVMQRMVKTMANPAYFIKDRINGWTGGLELFKRHPLFGAGLGTVYAASFKYMNKFFNLYSASSSFKHSHSEYIEVLGEGGIIGIIFFFSLFGYVIISLLKRVYSKKYNNQYRIISLAAATGIISMLIHQIFSLSFRMSVTMSAYFFLIGLGIFLISHSKNALLEEDDVPKKTILPVFLNKEINARGSKILIFIIALFLTIGLICFLPVFKSETYLVKAFPPKEPAPPLQASIDFINEAIRAKPDNLYVWVEKYKFDTQVTLFEGSAERINESALDDIQKNLDKQNSIIPGYQDIWTKYANLYMLKYNYYSSKWNSTLDYSYREKASESIKEALINLDKSINANYLNLYNHISRVLLLTKLENNQGQIEAVKDFIAAKTYNDFCKTRKIIKERVNIEFGNDTRVDVKKYKKNQDHYNFTISMDIVYKISSKCFDKLDSLYFENIEKVLNDETDALLKDLYPKE